jgi:hypothetical protein
MAHVNNDVHYHSCLSFGDAKPKDVDLHHEDRHTIESCFSSWGIENGGDR